jgi:hypothetical protein
MATISSNLVKKKHRHRGIYSGKPYEVAGRVFLPAGTALAVGDILLGVPVGENQRVKEVTVLVVGDAAGSGSVGYFQMLDGKGNPVKVQRRGPDVNAPESDTFVSPESDPDAFRAAGALTGYTRTQVTGDVGKLPGPVNVGVQITTAGTVEEDTEIFIGVVFDGETHPNEVSGGYPAPDLSYLL